jgi:FKBP-type peptidyl-prolyl cis-trans isomerase
MFPFLILLFALSADPEIPNPSAAAVSTAEGLVTEKLTAGTGTAHPRAGDLLVVRYTVWRPDGTIDRIEAPRKAKITLDKMLPGWRKAAEMMVVGETRRAWVPHNLGAGRIPEGKFFVIDTELVELFRTPDTPADVAAPPEDATRTESGLAYRILRPGTGEKRPRRSDRVVVHYTGWTTDGRMIDSSIIRGEVSEFGLGEVIRGWTEGLQLMKVGEKTRFWVPARLAYATDKSKPQGMLVFDIELVAIR